MFCSLCGARNEAEARFCRSCGEPMRAPKAPAPRPPAPEEPLPAVPYRPGLPPSSYAPPRAQIDAFPSPDNQQYLPHVDSHMALSILSLLLCCLPVGCVALYYSIQVGNAASRGDYFAAERASRMAKWWALGAVGAGLLSTLVFGLIGLLGVMAIPGS